MGRAAAAAARASEEGEAPPPEASDAPPPDVAAPAPSAALRLGGSVGAQGRNARADVLAVQGALNRRAGAGLVEDGQCGSKTIAAITAFQRAQGLRAADGRVDPGGPTERALGGASAAPAPQREGGQGGGAPREREPLAQDDLRGGSAPQEAPPDFRRLARQIHAATEGLGTDEQAILAALRELGGSPAHRARLGQVYREMFGEDLEAVLRDELSDDELDQAERAARQGEPDLEALARQIHAATEGVGTDEAAIQAALAQVSGRPERMARLRAVYRALFGEDLDAVLQDELSGADLRRAKDDLDPRRERIDDGGFEEGGGVGGQDLERGRRERIADGGFDEGGGGGGQELEHERGSRHLEQERP